MTTPDPVQLAAWLGCLVFVLGLFNQGSKALFTMRGKPSPAETQAATSSLSERIAKIENCIGSCKHEQDRRLDALEESASATRELVSVEIDKVFKRVNNVADASAEISGELTGIKRNLDLLLQRSINGRK